MAHRLNDLLSREVDRKQFLLETGGVMLGLVGLGGLIKLLSGPERRTIGYGSSDYGGRRNHTPESARTRRSIT
jgi:hypothetical protein